MKIRIPEVPSSASASGGASTLEMPSSRLSDGGYTDQPKIITAASRPTLEPPSEVIERELAPPREEAAIPETPLTPRPANRAADESVRWTSNDVYGAFSIERFAAAGPLSYTHEDAAGFINFLGGTGPANFWYQDAGVQPWAYYETYDNWQDTYGMDAVLATYHSGHGTMDGNGVFWAPLGAAWGGSSWVRSDQMRLGNEQANYIFWSTCLSCRVLGGHTPIRTWGAANLGFRMLFGFETVSWDNPNYGKFFGEEWRKGKSLSAAWLDASWRIAHDQAPSAVACGATAAEAQSRLFNERMFDWNHVSRNYWWWRWYYASSSANAASRQPNLKLPDSALTARLRSVRVDTRAVSELIDRIGLELRAPRGFSPLRDGSYLVREGDTQIAVSPDGSFEAAFAAPNRSNRTPLPAERAIAAATDYVRDLKLDQDVEVVFDRVRVGAEAGAGAKAGERVEGPFVTDTTVQFKQVIDGLPVVTPGAGEVQVSLDNDGHITAVRSSVRGVERMQEAAPRDPAAPSSRASDGPGGAAGYEKLLTAAWSDRVAAFALRGGLPVATSVVPNSTEIGYDVRGGEARVVVQQAIEVDFGQGLRKRYWVTAPLT